MKHLLVLVALLWLPVVALAVQQWVRSPKPISVGHLAATEGAKLLREWCSWLATLSTGAIGVASFANNGTNALDAGEDLAVVAVMSFAFSLTCTATLLLSLPSLVSRLKDGTHAENDLYELPAFLWAPAFCRKLFRVGFLAGAQYYFFIAAVGIVVYLFSTDG
jgi:hypothetical protein